MLSVYKDCLSIPLLLWSIIHVHNVHVCMYMYMCLVEYLPGQRETVMLELIYVHVHVCRVCFVPRVTSVNRVLSSQTGDSTSSEFCVIQLIPHLNLNAARLQQILQGDYA